VERGGRISQEKNGGGRRGRGMQETEREGKMKKRGKRKRVGGQKDTKVGKGEKKKHTKQPLLLFPSSLSPSTPSTSREKEQNFLLPFIFPVIFSRCREPGEKKGFS